MENTSEINSTQEAEEKNKEHTDISTRMKHYETESLSIIKIPPYMPFIVRLDGKGFSKLTKGMRKPFDLLFTKSMLLTTSDLLTEFTAATGYTHSDEISLIFRTSCEKSEFDKNEQQKFTHIFDGRII